MTRKKTKRKPRHFPLYSLTDWLLASDTDAMALEKITFQLTRMFGGQRAMELDASPSPDDWRVVTDAVNLMDTLVNHQGGRWWIDKEEIIEIKDASNLLPDAVQALAMAARRRVQTGVIRLDALGMQATRAVLQDYSKVIAKVPARIMLEAYRVTEKRIHKIRKGHKQPHDVEVMAL
jgi:hypothetical protein